MRCWLAILTLFVALVPAVAQRPPHPQQVVTRIAFGSCAYQDRPQRIWEAVRRYRPELFLFTGDNVYGDRADGVAVTDDDRLMGTLKAAYAKADTIEGHVRMRRDVPHLATWDDHDYGKNDAGADFVHREAAQAQFVEFWKLPANDPRRARPGVYHAEAFGPPGKRVQVILLDTRYFRSPLNMPGRPSRYVPDDSPEKTMLGPAQWQWLEEQLRQPADLRLIVSSIQVLAEGHPFERWGNLPRERKRLFDLISATKAGRTIFLSGDRHIAAIYRVSGSTPAPLYEVTSSGLTQDFPGARETDASRLGALYGAINFGTIDIDWWAETVTLGVRSVNGEVVRKVEVSFGDISAPP